MVRARLFTRSARTTPCPLDPEVIIKDDVIKGVSFTVVNHHALIQTGQLNWPIPLLVCAGALLIALGVILLSKKRKTDA